MECFDENVAVAVANGLASPELRDAAVEHIAVCDRCAGAVAAAAAESPTNPVVDGGPTLPSRGATIARYLVVEHIASGGLGAVFEAYDPQLDRKIALKLLRPGLSLDHKREPRLLREAQALARLSHPNVVAVHDVGVHDDQVFIAMELVSGGTLKDYLRKGRHPWRDVRDVFVQAGRGLAAAHRAGLVHRDFKPANVLFTPEGTVKVVDFGLARAAGRTLDAANELPRNGPLLDVELTATGVVVGTPAYMAPEQIAGAPVDARADQFSFCTTLYEALYGARPFAARSVPEQYDAIRNGPPSPPRARAIPGWLRRALLRGLEADPSRRFAHMELLLDALQHDRKARRRSLVLGIGAVTALAVGAVLLPRDEATTADDPTDALATIARDAAAKAYFIYPPPEQPDEYTALGAVLELEAMASPQGTRRAQALRDEFAQTLTHLGDRYWEREGGRAFAVEYYVEALIFRADVAVARDRASITPTQLAALEARLARQEFSDAELRAAAVVIALADPDDAAVASRIEALATGEHPPPPTISAQLDVLVHKRRPKPPEAPKQSVPETDVVPEPPAPDAASHSASPSPTRDAEAARRLVDSGDADRRKGRFADATAAYNQALARDPRSAAAHAGLGEVAFEQGRYAQAKRSFERAAKLAPRKARYPLRLGDAEFKLSDYAGARAAWHAASKLGADVSGRIDKIDRKLAPPPQP